LACAFTAHECLQGSNQLALRFTFGSRQLERGVPLWSYGIKKGSNIQSFPWPTDGSLCGNTAAPPHSCRCAWGEVHDDGHRGGSEVREITGDSATEAVQGPKTTWVALPVVVTTPFAQVNGTLEFPEKQWSSCRLSPSVLRKMLRISDVEGIHARREPSFSDGGWRLRLQSLHPFPGVQPPQLADIWYRLRATPARIEAWGLEGNFFHDAGPLVNEDDEWQLGLLDKDLVDGLHLSISLLRDAELAVDDVTVMFQETHVPASKEEVCAICLEPMRAGEMCRRLPCLHCLHAGCAMTLLPEAPSCPVCRSSISGGPELPEQACPEGSALSLRNAHAIFSLPAAAKKALSNRRSASSQRRGLLPR